MSLISDLYKLEKADIKEASIILADAFWNEEFDPRWKEVFEDEEQYRVMSEIVVRFCLRYGDVFSPSDNLEGVMAITPYDKPMTGWRTIRSGAFFLSMKISGVFKKMKDTSDLIEEEKEKLDIGPYIHLFIIGVSQEFQGKGFGGKLLRAVIEKSETERKPIYLETQKEENVGLYEKFGFSVKKKIILPEPLNLPMWLMVRNSN